MAHRCWRVGIRFVWPDPDWGLSAVQVAIDPLNGAHFGGAS
jgi:hypothetical protein